MRKLDQAKKYLKENERRLHQSLKNLLEKYDEHAFFNEMIHFEATPFSEVSNFMNLVGDGSSLVEKRKTFTKKLLKDWNYLATEMSKLNEDRKEEEEFPERIFNGYDFSVKSAIYKHSWKRFRELLNDYVNYVEKYYLTEDQILDKAS